MYIYYDETEGFVFKFVIKREVQYSKTVQLNYVQA